MNLNKYDAIILDCDGVVFDSNDLKIEAFTQCLSMFEPKIVDKFIEYFKNNFGTSRYQLFKVFITDFLKIDFDNNLYQDLLNKYSKKCISLYEEANLTPFFIDFIKKYKSKIFFIASGSDEEELKLVFRKRKLDEYFINIFGSPTKKTVIVQNIVSLNKNSVMIGDALSDRFAAKDSNIDFLFMYDYTTNKSMKKDESLKKIKNLGELI